MADVLAATVPVVVARVDGSIFGLLAAAVAEVVPVVAPSALPDAPAHVLGVVNVRGTLVAVLHLRSRLGRPTRALRLTDRIVVVDAGGLVGVLVDGVEGVTDIVDGVDLHRPNRDGGVVRRALRLGDDPFLVLDHATLVGHLSAVLDSRPPDG